MRPLLLQPRYSVVVKRPDGKNPLNITEDVESATLSVDKDMITVLTLSVKNTEKYIEFIDSGYLIEFHGGYFISSDYFSGDGRNGFNYTHGSTTEHYRQMFRGSIWLAEYNYASSGVKTLNIECRDTTWSSSAISRNYFAYPSKDCARPFANKDSLKLSEIIKGIADEIGLEAEVSLSNDREYTQKNPCVQHNQTDWAFLVSLAKQNSCYVSTDIDPTTGKYTLFFIDSGKARSTEDTRTDFVWLDRKDDYDFKDGDYLPTGNTSNELSKFKTNQIQLQSMSLTVSPVMKDSTGAVIQQVSFFDEKTGEQKELLVSYEETKDDLIYYELDTAKVEKMTRENPEEAKRITNMGAFNIPREVFMDYYTPKKFPKGVIKAIDMPLHGVDVTATIHGDVNIIPFKSYRIYGIGKWSSRTQNNRLRYYLHGITHTWDKSGFSTELNFKA